MIFKGPKTGPLRTKNVDKYLSFIFFQTSAGVLALYGKLRSAVKSRIIWSELLQSFDFVFLGFRNFQKIQILFFRKFLILILRKISETFLNLIVWVMLGPFPKPKSYSVSISAFTRYRRVPSIPVKSWDLRSRVSQRPFKILYGNLLS